jgi:hypothetical protein
VHAGWAIQLLVDVQFADHVFDDPLLVVGIENHKVGFDRQIVRLAPQDACANRVKRAEHDPLRGLIGEQALDALLHFPGSLVGECDGKNLPRADSFDRD